MDFSSDCIHHFVFINFLKAEAAEHNAVRDDFLFIGAMMFVFGCCQLWLCALSYLYDVYTVYIFPFSQPVFICRLLMPFSACGGVLKRAYEAANENLDNI